MNLKDVKEQGEKIAFILLSAFILFFPMYFFTMEIHFRQISQTAPRIAVKKLKKTLLLINFFNTIFLFVFIFRLDRLYLDLVALIQVCLISFWSLYKPLIFWPFCLILATPCLLILHLYKA